MSSLPWIKNSFLLKNLVSLLDILRAYAEAYVKGARILALLNAQIFYVGQQSGYDVRKDLQLIERLKAHLSDLLEHCQYLPMTSIAAQKLKAALNNSELMSTWTDTEETLEHMIADVLTRLEDELAINLFFKLPQERQKYFENPIDGWEEVIARFPDTVSNIEEMNKCFALSRYAAAVYHVCQTIELGLIEFGRFLEVKDPKSGWTAITLKLETLVKKTKYNDLEQKYKDCFGFLEQIHGTTEALKTAWRNKIDHAQGRLVLMTVDFVPDIAEEIMIASRSFMRRLATEMPK